jgi:glutamate 5-kinase
VKVGTSVITTGSGQLDYKQLEYLVSQIAKLVKLDYELILVTSGAIAAGMEKLGFSRRPKAIPELQAAASVGQGLLMHEYARLFSVFGLGVGQVLLTQSDFSHRQQYLNARNTLEKLLELRVVPIVNENDTTAVDEIRLGDNDTLAALVANLISADLLIILSDTEGLCTGDPRCVDKVSLIEEVKEITPEVERAAGGVGTKFGSGGMATKVHAAKIVTCARIAMVIAHGRRPNVLLDIVDGGSVGTFFWPKAKKLDSRKLWIAFGRIATGKVVVDEGAKEALIKGKKSLLPAGIVSCSGHFKVGDAVDIVDRQGWVFAKGLTNFSIEEVRQIMGLKTKEISRILPDAVSEEVVHRDCLVILD